MIFIDRTNKSPSPDWLNRATELTRQLLAAPDIAAKHRIIDENEALWTEIKDFLLGISYSKCWYSEAIETYDHQHVDHFRPKKVALGMDKKDHGGYWWLAFNWMNYRVCGGVGNVRKKDKFPVRSHKANNPTDTIEDELIYILDPCEEEDVLKITFNQHGEMMSITPSGWDFERASYTIESLNLNFKLLKEARKSIWVQCSTLILETQKLMAENNELEPSVLKKGQIKEKLKQLKELVQPTSAFSAVARTCLCSTGLEWAQKIK